MKNHDLKFHHIGLAVKHHESADIFLKHQGYRSGDIIYDPEQNVNLKFYESADGFPAVELVMPAGGESPLTPIFKRASEVIYHTCYETESLKESLDRLSSLDLRVITVSEPKPAILFGGKMVSFYIVAGFGLIEWLEV